MNPIIVQVPENPSLKHRGRKKRPGVFTLQYNVSGKQLKEVGVKCDSDGRQIVKSGKYIINQNRAYTSVKRITKSAKINNGNQKERTYWI